MVIGCQSQICNRCNIESEIKTKASSVSGQLADRGGVHREKSGGGQRGGGSQPAAKNSVR